MDRPRFLSIVARQDGTALPMAMLVLTILMSLTTAFIAMSTNEPLIAGNLKTADQALGLAEAGVERARWALNNSAAPASGLTSPLPAPVPAPYSGTLVALGTGAYQITVTTGATASERNIVAVGTVLRPGAALPGAAPIPQANIAAQRVVQVTLQTSGVNPGNMATNIPGALTVGGSVQSSGNTAIAGGSTSCGAKTGVTYTKYDAAGLLNNAPSTSGNASITGSPSGTGMIDNTGNPSQFPGFSAADLASLKALAQASGTYIQPTSGSISIASGTTTMNGLIFVDTINGQSISDPFNSSTDASKLVSASISGNFSGSGWIVVMGSLSLSGNTSYNGLIYALNDIQASGNTAINGAVMSQNVMDSVATTIDTQTSGNSHITYDCSAISTGGGYLPSAMTSGGTFSLKAGTWKACPVGAC